MNQSFLLYKVMLVTLRSNVVPQGFFSLGITVSVHEVALWKVTNADSLARFFFFNDYS